MSRLHDEAGSTSWLYERTTSARRALVEPASSCKRSISSPAGSGRIIGRNRVLVHHELEKHIR